MNIGFLIAEDPDVRYRTIIPAVATIIATGSNRVSGLPDVSRGRSGGGFTTISPSDDEGAARRGSIENSIGE